MASISRKVVSSTWCDLTLPAECRLLTRQNSSHLDIFGLFHLGLPPPLLFFAALLEHLFPLVALLPLRDHKCAERRVLPLHVLQETFDLGTIFGREIDLVPPLLDPPGIGLGFLYQEEQSLIELSIAVAVAFGGRFDPPLEHDDRG